MKLKLYHAKWSLCSQMVRVAMEEKGLPYESNLIKLCDQYPEAENLSPEYLAINPKGIVPSLDLDGKTVTESTNIIKKLNSLSGENDIDLWPVDVDQGKLNSWVEDTTLTDGVPFGKTLGTAIPPFSLILINFMVKKYLSFFQAIKVFWKHPLRERGRGFLAMKFFNIHKPIAASSYKVLVKSLMDIEKNLENSGPYFLGKFSHIDINLMCCFHRLSDVRLEKLLEIEELPNIKKYWELLKSRDSYQKCILDFYGEKEYGNIEEVYKQSVSMHLEPIKSIIKNYKT